MKDKIIKVLKKALSTGVMTNISECFRDASCCVDNCVDCQLMNDDNLKSLIEDLERCR